MYTYILYILYKGVFNQRDNFKIYFFLNEYISMYVIKNEYEHMTYI